MSRLGWKSLVANRRLVRPHDRPHDRPRYRSQHRRAHTLIELVASLSIGSAVMTLAIGVVHQAMTFHSLGTARELRERSLVRMTRQFRTDVRQASSYQLDPSGSLQLTQFDGRSIDYSIGADQVVRTEVGGDQQTWVERYSLGERSTATVAIASEEPETIGLIVKTDVGLPSAAVRVDRQVTAVPGATVRRLSP